MTISELICELHNYPNDTDIRFRLEDGTPVDISLEITSGSACVPYLTEVDPLELMGCYSDDEMKEVIEYNRSCVVTDLPNFFSYYSTDELRKLHAILQRKYGERPCKAVTSKDVW